MRGRGGDLEGRGDFPVEIVHDLVRRAAVMNPRAPKEEIARWFDSKPPFASWFTRGEKVTVLANAKQTEITAFLIPHGMYGVLRFFGNACALNSDYPSITFTVDVDGVPLEGFGSIVGPISPSIQSPIPMMDALLGGQRVRVAASNSSAGTITAVQGFLRGWFWIPAPDGAKARR